GKAITFQTLSMAELSDSNLVHTYQQFQNQLSEWYPNAFNKLEITLPYRQCIILKWVGSNQKSKPVLWLAHQDVVDCGAPESWKHPCFQGNISKDSFVYGRGTLDMKIGIIGMLEAVEKLLLAGYQPETDLYFAFSDDEETLGKGAQAMNAWFLKLNRKFEYILDEGGSTLDGLIPNIDGPVACIGVAEKGYLTIELIANGKGGHSSSPGIDNVVNMISAAVYRLENNSFPTKLIQPVKESLRAISVRQNGLRKFIFRNPVYFSRFIKKELCVDPYGESLLRTTVAPTIMRAGKEDNVLPTTATITVNCRILPGETIASVLKRINKTINDTRIIIRPTADATEPPKITSIHTKAYKVLEKSILKTIPNALVIPILNISTSDSRYYTELTDNILRFIPIKQKPGDQGRTHGIDERIHVSVIAEAVSFYSNLLQLGEF
ncbi:MAG: M20/M25/M40 family metallo-hydrolase, partial [Bacteroidota bacterium]|nr:M20/M25/M40 family metallo-hydrolase [Bacteroidota bacterium]